MESGLIASTRSITARLVAIDGSLNEAIEVVLPAELSYKNINNLNFTFTNEDLSNYSNAKYVLQFNILKFNKFAFKSIQ